MPIHYILANLLAEADDAVAVLLVDDRGETVDLASASPAPADVRLTGAYMALHLRQLTQAAGESRLGKLRRVHVAGGRLNIFLEALPEGYALVLLQRSPALVARAGRRATEAAEELRRELFF